MTWEKVIFSSLFEEPTKNGVYKTAAYRGKGVKIVNMGELFAYDFINSQPMQRVEMSEKEMANNGLKKNDLLFARRSLVESGAGKVSIICDLNEPTTFESSIIRVRLDEKKCCPLFYLYWLRSCAGREAISALVNGVNVKGIRASALKDIFIDYPNKKIQQHIAGILSAYDNLIENNRKQIKLLEEAAQRLYREWFVDLRFPGHENTAIVDGVPEGWKRVSLNEVIAFNPQVTLDKERTKQSVPMSALSTTSMVLDSNEFTETTSISGAKFQNGDTLLARITPCLENGKTAFVSGILSDEGAVGSTEFIVMRSVKLNPYMVYLLARTDKFRETAIKSMTGSDGRQRVQVDTIKNFPYLLPVDDIIRGFEDYVKPFFEQVSVKQSQNAHLAEARDRLLPKLMSGEIEV